MREQYTALVRDTRASGALLRSLGAADVRDEIVGDFDLILDAVGGRTFGLAIEHLAPRGIVVNIATQSEDESVTFRAPRFDRAKGARIYTLNLFDELDAHASGAGDLARLCGSWPTDGSTGRSSSRARGVTMQPRWQHCWSVGSAARSCSTSTDRRHDATSSHLSCHRSKFRGVSTVRMAVCVVQHRGRRILSPIDDRAPDVRGDAHEHDS